MKEEYLVSEEGLEELKEEKTRLLEQRKLVADRIKTAKEYGDLSENAEYIDAKNEQAFVEGALQEVEWKIKHAKVVEKDTSRKDIGLGSIVTLVGEEGEEHYTIVSPGDAKPLQGKISLDSPIAQALSGHQINDKVKVSTPAGELEYKIKSVK